MKIEDQIWEDLCARKMYASAHMISSKLGLVKSTVRQTLLKFYRQGLLERKMYGLTAKYRIKE